MDTLEAPAVGSRAWAAALIDEYGEKLGAEYFGRQLSLDEAEDDYQSRQPRQRKGFAERLGRSQAMQRLASSAPPDELPDEPPARGFASKIRFPGE